MKKKKCTIKKFEGDDSYSWAVFRAADVKGMTGVIFSGDASPLVTGCSRDEANHYKKQFENN